MFGHSWSVDKGDKGGLSEKAPFKLKLKEERAPAEGRYEESAFQAKGAATAKALRQKRVWLVGGAVRPELGGRTVWGSGRT